MKYRVIAFVLYGLLCVLLWGCVDHIHTTEYLVPAGYKGWYAVEYRVAGSDPLPQTGDLTTVALPASGYLQTSSDADFTPGQNRFYYVNGSVKQKQLLWQGQNENGKEVQTTGVMVFGGSLVSEGHGDSKDVLYTRFFIGTKKAYEAAQPPNIAVFRLRRRLDK